MFGQVVVKRGWGGLRLIPFPHAPNSICHLCPAVANSNRGCHVFTTAAFRPQPLSQPWPTGLQVLAALCGGLLLLQAQAWGWVMPVKDSRNPRTCDKTRQYHGQ